MNDICERLRSAVQLRRAARDAIDPAIGLPHTDLMLDAANEIARLRLTDAEREAIEIAINCCRVVAGPLKLNLKADEAAATLRGLLERLA